MNTTIAVHLGSWKLPVYPQSTHEQAEGLLFFTAQGREKAKHSGLPWETWVPDNSKVITTQAPVGTPSSVLTLNTIFSRDMLKSCHLLLFQLQSV